MRVRADRLLWAVIALLLVSLATLGVTVFGSFQARDIIRGQKVIEERVTPLCLSEATRDACKRQINAAKRSVVVRLCKVVHERLSLPRVECENALAAAVKRNAAASADGGRAASPRAPPTGGADKTRGANTEQGVGAPKGHPGKKHPGKKHPHGSPPGQQSPGNSQGSGRDGPGNSENSNGKSSSTLPELLPPGLQPELPDPGKGVGKAVGQTVEEAGKAVGKVVEGALGE